MTDADQLLLITERGQLIRLKVKDVRETGRAAQGVRLIDLDEGDRVVAVAKLAEPDEDDEEAQAALPGAPGGTGPRPGAGPKPKRARRSRRGVPRTTRSDEELSRYRRGLLPARHSAIESPPSCGFFWTAPAPKTPRRVRDLGPARRRLADRRGGGGRRVEYRRSLREMAALTTGPCCAELGSADAKGMYKEARELAKLGKDVVVQLPLHPDGMRVARLLAQDQIAVCVSGCYSAAQALIAAKANVAYVAPAVGSLDAVGAIGMDLVEQIIRIYDNYGFQTQILVSACATPSTSSMRR